MTATSYQCKCVNKGFREGLEENSLLFYKSVIWREA